jgi:hypothetical protein
MKITILQDKNGEYISEELNDFKEKLIAAIKEARIALIIKKEDINSLLNKVRELAFQEIEESMIISGFEDYDLGEYSNYQAQINSLNKLQDIRVYQSEVEDFIIELGKEKKKRENKSSEISAEEQKSAIRKENWRILKSLKLNKFLGNKEDKKTEIQK